MHEITNIFLAGDEFMPEMQLKVPGLQVPVDHLLKTKKEYQNLNKPEI